MEKPLKCPENDSKHLKLKKLSLIRSGHTILHELNLKLPRTGVTVLLGANGAGKSTLLSVLSGISDFDSGELQLPERTSVCLMPEPAVFYPQLTVAEQLSFLAHLFNQNKSQDQLDTALELWQLTAVRNKLTRHLSLGYRQRLSLAQLSVSGAGLWLLDEPMNGMDPEVLSVFKSQIMTCKQSTAIVMATHIMHEAQDLADWVVVMHLGQIIYSAKYDQRTQFYNLYQQAIQAHHKWSAANGLSKV